jgi:hypothetical protein
LDERVSEKVAARLFAVFIENLEKVYLDLVKVFAHNGLIVRE